MSINCTGDPIAILFISPQFPIASFNFLPNIKKERRNIIGFKSTIICQCDNKIKRMEKILEAEEKHIISLFTLMFSTKIFDRL